jgi:class 3 adenylate cyclase
MCANAELSMVTTQRTRTPLLIVFLDLTRYQFQSQQVEDAELADTINGFYSMVASAVDAAGGRTVKFIGDAALIVFPESAIDRGVQAMLELKPAVDRSMAAQAWECRLRAKIHFGEVIAGEFGPPGNARYDVIGRAVNTAAVLETVGVTLSAEAFRKLSPEMRQRFKKHTPPITYIRVDDQRPGRR